MLSSIARWLASVSLTLKQPLPAFCDLETAHGEALVTKRGEYLSWIKVDGLQRMGEAADYAAASEAMRLDLSGALEAQGHALMAWYMSDPDAALAQIELVCLQSCRAVARQAGLDLRGILDERARLWPQQMRWEVSYLIVWTKPAVLTKEERKQLKAEYAANAKQVGALGGAGRFTLRSEVMAARHAAFASRVLAAFRTHGIAARPVLPHEALQVVRSAMSRETAASEWRPALPGDRVMARAPEEGEAARPGHLLWPPIRDQVFVHDAVTAGGQRVEMGDNAFAPVDMYLGPEQPQPFERLAAILGRDRIPWRCSFLIEGGGKGSFGVKDVASQFLTMFPGNGELRRAFAFLRGQAEDEQASVKLRASFATWAPVEDAPRLRRRRSLLAQRMEGWGNCKATSVVGDPLEAVMSSAPGLALASTANPALALLDEALLMLPWNRTASPWETGSVLFRRPDGAIWVYDPAGGRMRPLVVDVFVAPPGSGKSVLANSINIGLILSSAALGSGGAKLPLIGKMDIGRSVEGFIILVQEALGARRKHEAIFVSLQFAPGYEFNIFDLQTGCDYPLPLERVFQSNFLALATTPPDRSQPFEGMTHLIEAVIDEAYRLCASDEGAKHYRRGAEPEIDAAILRHRIQLHPERPYWRDVVAALCALGEWRLAEVAQRHAVPILQDLIRAARTDQINDSFRDVRVQETGESAQQIFERYIKDLIKRFPTLNVVTRLDFGPARIIGLDLQSVAPKGSPAAQRQTEMMYLLGRHILARNFFLHPEYAAYVPEHVRDYHLQRFTEVWETTKRVDYDEWHRTLGSPLVCAQAERDVREGRKHNVQLGFASQRLGDFSAGIIEQSTGRFILGADGQREKDAIVECFGLTDASAKVVNHRLTGPDDDGAPFLAIFKAGQAQYEQMLVNSLGPVELWALSTTPQDTSLRSRIYARVGFGEGLRRLSKVFPRGSALKEIEHRTKARLRKGDAVDQVEAGIVDGLADELVRGYGLGLVLRPHEDGGDAEPSVAFAAAAE